MRKLRYTPEGRISHRNDLEESSGRGYGVLRTSLRVGFMLDDHPELHSAEPDCTSLSRRRGNGRRPGSGHLPSDDDLVAWLVDIVARGPGDQCSHDLAHWLMAVLPRRHWAVAGHLWCSMNAGTPTWAGVVYGAGLLTDEQARHVLWAVRRRARGAIRDELASQSALRHREVPMGDLRSGAVA
jgi:hypothetical protein